MKVTQESKLALELDNLLQHYTNQLDELLDQHHKQLQEVKQIDDEFHSLLVGEQKFQISPETLFKLIGNFVFH